MVQVSDMEWVSRSRWPVLIGGVAILLIVSLSFLYFRSIYLTDLQRLAAGRMAVYQSALNGIVSKYDYLPYALARDDNVLKALEDGEGTALNPRLADLAAQSGASALYVMTTDGTTIASSNWQDAGSFVGKNYAFRPYFRDAMQSGQGSFYAIGATTQIPGVFISHQVPALGRPEGVVVAKVDLRPLEQSWASDNETVFVTDARGIVLLSSRSDWRYNVLAPLDADVLSDIRRDRQFDEQTHGVLPIESGSFAGNGEIRLAGVDYVHRSLPVGLSSWHIHYLTPVRPVLAQAGYAVAIEVAILSAILAIAFFFRARTLRKLSNQLRDDAIELRLLNGRLADEVEERKRAEQGLKDTQKSLVQAGKLATLGQMATAIVHELNQPLAAARTFLAGTGFLIDTDRPDEARENVRKVDDLMKRMAFITKELKSFARQSDDVLRPVVLQEALSSALSIANVRLKAHDVTVVQTGSDIPLMVLGDQVRIEQVLLNLIQNAADAMRQSTDRVLTITVKDEAGEAMMLFSDTGEGLPDAQEDRLFDPFFTTKAQGEGLGLGLAISTTILGDLNGRLEAANNEVGGATFRVRLPLYSNAAEPALETRLAGE